MDSDDDDDPDPESWNAEAHFTNANYQAKKMVLLLFINRPSYFYDSKNEPLAQGVWYISRSSRRIISNQKSP